MKIIDELPKLRRHAVRFFAESDRDERVLRKMFSVFRDEPVVLARMERSAADDFNQLVIEEIEGA